MHPEPKSPHWTVLRRGCAAEVPSCRVFLPKLRGADRGAPRVPAEPVLIDERTAVSFGAAIALAIIVVRGYAGRGRDEALRARDPPQVRPQRGSVPRVHTTGPGAGPRAPAPAPTTSPRCSASRSIDDDAGADAASASRAAAAAAAAGQASGRIRGRAGNEAGEESVGLRTVAKIRHYPPIRGPCEWARVYTRTRPFPARPRPGAPPP
eukprot:scaffold7384_cov396-Prasinococcus_capsulatus_cf.AAC.13